MEACTFLNKVTEASLKLLFLKTMIMMMQRSANQNVARLRRICKRSEEIHHFLVYLQCQLKSLVHGSCKKQTFLTKNVKNIFQNVYMKERFPGLHLMSQRDWTNCAFKLLNSKWRIQEILVIKFCSVNNVYRLQALKFTHCWHKGLLPNLFPDFSQYASEVLGYYTSQTH